MRLRTSVCCLTFSMLVGACTPEAPARGGRYNGIELKPARPKADFTLTRTDGRPFDFRESTDGHLTLLFFGYTACPDICPVHMANIAAALERLTAGERARVRVVFVSTDPDRDTPQRLQSWLAHFDSSFIGVSGAIEDVNRIEQQFGLAASVTDAEAATDTAYGVGHAAQVLAFTPDDSLRVMYPFGTRQQDWVADLPRLLKFGAGRAAASRQDAPPAAAAPPAFHGGSLAIHNVVAPASVPAGDGTAPLAVYFLIMNSGAQADTLDAIDVPGGVASLHEQVQRGGGRSSMSEVAAAPIPAGETLRFTPGGRHVMVERAGSPPSPGDSLPMTMVFRRAGRIPVAARVVAYADLERAIAAGGDGHAGHED